MFAPGTDLENKVAYVHDQNLQMHCNRIPMVLDRANMLDDLISSYGLYEYVVKFAATPAGTCKDLMQFHSLDYLKYLHRVNYKDPQDTAAEDRSKHGLEYDCPLLPRIYDFACWIGGSTAIAAKILATTNCRRVINWHGGWHHAQKNRAEGFCYVNDIVIGIRHLLLSEKFKKILYVDLDVHHGDAVENAFETTGDVLTLSFHKHSPGFYPGSGLLEDVGFDDGKYYAMNVPFKDHINSRNYTYLFKAIFATVCNSFMPDVMVVQCGGDILTGDQVGGCNVTIEAMVECVQMILGTNVPSMFLGGGGYNIPNTVRYWTYLTALICGETLPNDIPDRCEYFLKYTPTYELSISPHYTKDENSKEYLDQVIGIIIKYCDNIKT